LPQKVIVAIFELIVAKTKCYEN